MTLELQYRCNACGKMLEKKSPYCENCWRKVNTQKIEGKKHLQWMKKIGFNDNPTGFKIYKAMKGILK